MKDGLTVRGMRIRRCSHKPSHSRSFKVQDIVFQEKFLPVLVYWNIVSLNTAVSVTPRRTGSSRRFLCFRMEENSIISPMALGSGGRPKFAQARSSHVSGNRVNMYFSPRLILSVRVLVRS